MPLGEDSAALNQGGSRDEGMKCFLKQSMRLKKAEVGSHSTVPLARQVLLLHNTLFELLSNPLISPGAPKYLLCARGLRSLLGWRELSGSGTGTPWSLPCSWLSPGAIWHQILKVSFKQTH